jgi:hypothetical protein
LLGFPAKLGYKENVPPPITMTRRKTGSGRWTPPPRAGTEDLRHQSKKEEQMLSLRDCLDFCDLDFCEIEAIAEHEHLPVIVAAELSNELLKTPEGICCLHSMVLENMSQAMTEGDMDKAMRCHLAYQHLAAHYPISRYAHIH